MVAVPSTLQVQRAQSASVAQGAVPAPRAQPAGAAPRVQPAAVTPFTVSGAAAAAWAAVPGAASAAVEATELDPTLLAVGGFVAVGGVLAAIYAVATAVEKPSIKSTTPAAAYEALAESPDTVLVDIRPSKTIKEDGTPDIRATKKRVVLNPYTKIVKEEEVVIDAWAERMGKLKSIKEDSKIVLIDENGANALKAAKALLAVRETEGPVTIYYVEGGVEGWKADGLPYKEAFKGLNLRDLSKLDLKQVAKSSVSFATDVTRTMKETYDENPSVINGIALGAVAVGGSAVLFAELDTILQIVGVLGAVRFLATRLLFSKDREQTIAELKELFGEKIAAGEVSSDLKRLGDAIVGSGDTTEEFQENMTQLVSEVMAEELTEKEEGALGSKDLPDLTSGTMKIPGLSMESGTMKLTGIEPDPDTAAPSDADAGTMKITEPQDADGVGTVKMTDGDMAPLDMDDVGTVKLGADEAAFEAGVGTVKIAEGDDAALPEADVGTVKMAGGDVALPEADVGTLKISDAEVAPPEAVPETVKMSEDAGAGAADGKVAVGAEGTMKISGTEPGAIKMPGMEPDIIKLPGAGDKQEKKEQDDSYPPPRPGVTIERIENPRF